MSSHLTPAAPCPAECALLGVSAGLSALATDILLSAFPAIARSRSIDMPELALMLSAFCMPFACGQLLLRPGSDRWGRRRLLLGGLALLALGSGVAAWATDHPTLLLGRTIQGLGAGALSVLARSIARDSFEGQALLRALAFIMVAMAAAPGFSHLLGDLLSGAVGWRSLFWLVAALALLMALPFVRLVGELLAPAPRGKVPLLAVLRADAQLLGRRSFMAPALAVGLGSASLTAFFAATPIVFMSALGLSPVAVGGFFACMVLVVFAAVVVAPRWAVRLGALRVTLLGVAVTLVGGTAVRWGPSCLWFFGLSVALFLLGTDLLNPLGTAQTGAASALCGGVQMGLASLVGTLVSAMQRPAQPALDAVLLVAGMLLALLCLRALAPTQSDGASARATP